MVSPDVLTIEAAAQPMETTVYCYFSVLFSETRDARFQYGFPVILFSHEIAAFAQHLKHIATCLGDSTITK